MITALSGRVTEVLVSAGVIPGEERELYSYGFFMLFSQVLFLVVSMVFGLLWHVLLGSVLFFLQFACIRGYAGGVHAEKERDCLLFTTLSLFLSVAGIRLLREWGARIPAIGISAVCAVLILWLSPLESAEKPLTSSERRRYWKITSTLVLSLALIAWGLAAMGWDLLLFSTTAALALEAALLVVGTCQVKRNTSAASD